MVKPISTQAIEIGTATSWETWCAALDAAGARDLDHNGIVKAARKLRTISGWWAQGVAVAYEQHIGRRKPGQTSDGLFSVSLSRTEPGTQASVFKAWCGYGAKLTGIKGVPFARAPSASETAKWMYWRGKLQDGSAVAISMMAKSGTKTLIAVEHRKLRSQDQTFQMKQAWAAHLEACFNA